VEVESGDPNVCVPGCPVQPDNFMETLLEEYLGFLATRLIKLRQATAV
jgi:Ni,Fe-hydrogenase I small subunit